MTNKPEDKAIAPAAQPMVAAEPKTAPEVPARVVTKTLAEGLVVAQRAARAIEKDAKNAHFHYAYASGEAVIAEAKEALSAGDLAFYVKKYEILTMTLQPITAEELEKADGVLFVTYVLVHSSGEREELTSPTPIIPERGRPPDKALAAAKTYDLSYMLRALLQMPRVKADDGKAPEVDDRDDGKYEPPARGQQNQRGKGKKDEKASEKPAEPKDPAKAQAEKEASDRMAHARDRLRALAQFHGEDKCKAVIGDQKRKTVEDYESQAKLLEEKLGPLPEGFKPVLMASPETLWETAKREGYNGTEPPFVEAMTSLFGTANVAELTPEQRTVFVLVLNSGDGLLDTVDSTRADVEMTYSRKPNAMTAEEWRKWIAAVNSARAAKAGK